jgi:hypothetical protein
MVFKLWAHNFLGYIRDIGFLVLAQTAFMMYNKLLDGDINEKQRLRIATSLCLGVGNLVYSNAIIPCKYKHAPTLTIPSLTSCQYYKHY